MVVNNIQERFSQLGFSEYESKTYSALLRIQPATAYETAREAGIPTSKIYEVFDRLLGRGLVSVLEVDGKKRYVPQPAEEFIEKTRKFLGKTLDDLKIDLGKLGEDRDASYIWNVSRYEELLEKSERMIDSAQKSILLSSWNLEAMTLAPYLSRAHERGLKTAVVHFGPGELHLPNVFHHPIEDTIYREKGGRDLVLIADGKEALTGTIHEDGVVEGAWSHNRGFVTLAEDYVKHDIYIMKIVSRMDGELHRRFGEGYALLRDVWSDKEVS